MYNTTTKTTPIPTSTSIKTATTTGNTNVNGNEIIFHQNTGKCIIFKKMKCNVTLFGQKKLKHF